jgi:branched-chain amino acid transport system substrate-binding protein
MDESTDEEDVVKIGIFEPLSGAYEEAGKQELMGIELAHELYSTVLGKTVLLVKGDNKSEISLAGAAAQHLVDQGVAIVLGSYGNTLSLAGGDYFQEAGIPAIAITNTNPLVTKGNPFYFRVSIVDSFQGIMAAKYIFNDMGLSHAVVMKAAEDDYGSAMSQAFSDKLIALTGDPNAITSTLEYHQGTEDYGALIESLKATGVGVVFLTGTAEEAAAIVMAARSQGLTTRFVGTDLWHQESLIEDAGAAAEGMVFTTYFDVESQLTEKTDELLAAYRAKYGEDQEPASAVALGFDAYLVALDAIRRQEEQKVVLSESLGAIKNTQLRDVLQETKDFVGATGGITFDENGDPIKPVVFITVENGEFIHKYTAEPEWN